MPSQEDTLGCTPPSACHTAPPLSNPPKLRGLPTKRARCETYAKQDATGRGWGYEGSKRRPSVECSVQGCNSRLSKYCTTTTCLSKCNTDTIASSKYMPVPQSNKGSKNDDKRQSDGGGHNATKRDELPRPPQIINSALITHQLNEPRHKPGYRSYTSTQRAILSNTPSASPFWAFLNTRALWRLVRFEHWAA